MKSIKWSAIIIALAYIAAGSYFFFYPQTTEETICTILGFALIAVGLLNIMSYFSRSNEDSFFRDDFKYGLIIITVGCFALAFKPLFTELAYVCIGIIIMNSGFGKLQDCVDTWRLGSNHGFLYIFLAAVNIIIGLLVAINPFTNTLNLHYLIAGGLAFSGVSDLFSSIYLSTKMALSIRDKKREAEEAKKAEEELNQQIEAELNANLEQASETVEEVVETVAEPVVEAVTETVNETENSENTAE